MKILAIIVLMIFALLLWLSWDTKRNRGYEFGYYGAYNRVSNSIASLPGVIITSTWYNGDISLEEFQFDLMLTNGSLSLFFGERDPIRRMSRDRRFKALAERIQKHSQP